VNDNDAQTKQLPGSEWEWTSPISSPVTFALVVVVMALRGVAATWSPARPARGGCQPRDGAEGRGAGANAIIVLSRKRLMPRRATRMCPAVSLREA
jgi:hypothetical protein